MKDEPNFSDEDGLGCVRGIRFAFVFEIAVVLMILGVRWLAIDGKQVMVAGVKDLTAVKAIVVYDWMDLKPPRLAGRTFVSEGLPVYEYRFSYVANCMRSQWTGVRNAYEAPRVFKPLSTINSGMDPCATNFVKTGDLNGSRRLEWPEYLAKEDVLMNFTAAGKPVAIPDPFNAWLDVVEKTANGVAAEPKR